MKTKMKKIVLSVSGFLKKPIVKAVLLVLVAAIPFIFNNNHYANTLTLIAVMSISVLGYNFMAGFAGTFYLCQPAFYGVGAYASSLMAMYLGIPPIISILLAGFFTAGVGYLLSLPTMRMKEMFLIIGTVAFHQIMYAIFINATPVTGGVYGLKSIPSLRFFGQTLNSKQIWLVAFTYLCLCYIVLKNILLSKTGRLVMSMAKDPAIGAAMGANTSKYRSFAFSVAAFMGGVAGAIYAHYIGYIFYGNFTLELNTQQLAMMALGGLGSLPGSILGPTILVLLTESLATFYNYRMLIYGVLLIACMLFRPKGLLGGRPVGMRKEAVECLHKYSTADE